VIYIINLEEWLLILYRIIGTRKFPEIFNLEDQFSCEILVGNLP